MYISQKLWKLEIKIMIEIYNRFHKSCESQKFGNHEYPVGSIWNLMTDIGEHENPNTCLHKTNWKV